MVEMSKDIVSSIALTARLPRNLSYEALQNAIEKYPAAHSLYLFKAMLLKSTSEEELNDELPQIAARVTDRSQLYDLLHPKSGILLQELETPLEIQLDEILVSENTIDNEDIAEEATQIVEVIEESEPEKPAEEFVQLEAIEESLLEETFSPPAENHIEEIVSVETEAEPSTLNLSFVDWLKLKKTKTNPAEELQPKQKSTYEPIPIDPTAATEAQILLESKENIDQLDRFISEEIYKKKNRKQSKQPLETSTKVTAKTTIVSETFAEILVLQKKYEEAIATYHSLSLKYPQKSSYFASRIEKIKNYK
jgi:hypothetical protein